MARTFDSLRAKPVPQETPEFEILKLAVRKIAATTEGQTLLTYMRWYAGSVPPPDASDGALRELNGVRRFVAQIEAMISVGERHPE